MVACYPIPAKQKSRLICEAFAEGCGGALIEDGRLRDGAMFVYGVMPGNEQVWRQAQDGRDIYFADNAYFDPAREQYFRIAKNRLQHSGAGVTDGERFAALGVRIAPWRRAGSHIVVCPQSEHFMRVVALYRGDWTADVLGALKTLTDRPIKVRAWDRNKGKQAATLAQDLAGAHALVTWSSAAAVTALLAGVPVVCTGPSACAPMSGTIDQIENLPLPEREVWAGVLADSQWSLEEIRNGTAWSALNHDR